MPQEYVSTPSSEPFPSYTGTQYTSIVIGRSLNHTNNGLVRLQVIHLSDEPIILPKNINLGKLVPLLNNPPYIMNHLLQH